MVMLRYQVKIFYTVLEITTINPLNSRKNQNGIQPNGFLSVI